MEKVSNQTTTLYDLIHSELIQNGFNEFENDEGFTFFNPENAFIKKVMKYDEDVERIVNEKFFQNEKLKDDESDKHFKKTFVNKFLNNSIQTQTIESFASKVVYTFLVNNDYIDNVYDVNRFVSGESTSNATNEEENNSSNENRNARSDLPQSQHTVNVDNTELDFANEFTLMKSKDKGNNKSQNNTTNKQYNVENLIKIKGLLEMVFIDFNKNCFKQVF